LWENSSPSDKLPGATATRKATTRAVNVSAKLRRDLKVPEKDS
jgi:hypothetical protein